MCGCMAWEGLFGGGSSVGSYDFNKSLFGKPIPPISGPGITYDVPVNAYGVPLDANNNLGLYGQLENAKNLDTSQNGGVFGFASEVLFGEKPPQLPSSVAEGILGGSLGEELGKTIKPLALPLALVVGLYLLTKGKL